MGRSGRYRWLPVAGSLSLAVGMLLLSRLSPDTSILELSLALLIVGAGLGFIFPVITTAVQNAVPRAVMGTATAAGLMFRQIGGSLAVAAFGAIFAARLAGLTGGALPAGEIGPQVLAGLPPEVQAQIGGGVAQALHPIFWIAAGLAALGLAFAWMLEEVPLSSQVPARGE